MHDSTHFDFRMEKKPHRDWDIEQGRNNNQPSSNKNGYGQASITPSFTS